jgi:PAS domain S-box-containing protein
MGGPDDVGAVLPWATAPAAAPAAGSLRRRRRHVWLLTAGAIALLLGTVFWFEWNEQQKEIRAASALAERSAGRLADELTQALQMAKAAIAQTEDKLQRMPAGTAVATALGELALDQARLLASLPMPIHVHALDARGRSMELAPGSAPPSAADHEHPSPADLPSASTWFVAPTQGPEGSRVVPLLRRAAPNVHGVVAFAAELDHQALVARLERSRLRNGGGAAVFRVDPDGSVLLLARAPYAIAELGQRLRGPVAKALTSQPRGTFDTVTQIDQLRRVVAFQRLEGDAANLVVTYGVETRGVLAEWTAQMPLVVGITLLLVAGLLWGGWRLDRSLQALARGQLALQRSENHFRALTGNLPDVVTRFDADFRHLYANPSVERATGLQPPAFIGKTNEELGMATANVQLWNAALKRVFASGRSERLVFDYQGPQGVRHWESQLVLEPPLGGEGPTVLVISRDITDRLRADKDRESLSRHLLELLDGMSDAFVSLDRQWRYRFVNRKAGQMFGREPASLLGRHIWTEFPDGVGQPFHRAYERAMNEGVPIQLEEYYPPFERWFENRIQPGPDGISIFFTDITERKQREAELRRLHATLEALVQGSTDAIFVKDGEGRYIVANRAAAALLGRPLQELLGAVDRTLFPPETAQAIHADDERVKSARTTESYEETLPAAGGMRSLLTTKGPLIIAGEVQGVFGISRDITERQQALQALRESEARHRRLFEANPHAMWVFDQETLRFLAVNDAAVAQYGYSREEFLAMTIQDIRPSEEVPRMLSSLAQGIQGTEEGGVWRHVRRDGQPLEVEVTSHALEFMGRPAKLVRAHDVTRRNQAELALRESEERLRLALAASQQGLYDLDLRTGQAVVSPEYARMLGYEPEELHESNQAWRERLHPEDRQRVVEAFDGYLAGRTPEYRVEFRQRTRQGGWKWILSMGSIQARDEAGAPLRMLGTHTDITVEREAQAALRHSELRFRLAASYGQVWEWDFGSGGLLPSMEFFELLGFAAPAPQEVAARFAAMVPPEDYQRMKDSLRRHLKGQGDYHLQFRAFDSQGRQRWFETQGKAVINEQGRATYMAGTTFEITERRQAEDAVRQLAADLEQRVRERTAELARSEARYRTIFEAVPVAIGEEDWAGVQQLLRELRTSGVEDGPAHFAAHPLFVRQCMEAVRIVRLNRKALDLHDISGRTEAPSDLRAFYPSDEHLPEFVGEIEALWLGKRQYTARKSLPSASGRPLQLMMTMSLPALHDDDGTALVCLVDITEIDRLNEELDRTVARLRQMNRELETFTYSVSHDLKAPLRGIDGYSRLLLSDHGPALDEEGRQFLGHIRQATQHMGVLIDDLLAYSRLERRDVTMSPLRLAPLVESVLAPYRQEGVAPGLEVVVELAPELLARADAQGLTIALRNLVDNAVKFSRQAAAPRVRIVGTRVPGGVRLAVEDNGLGFDMKFHDRIFAIFQRLHRAEHFPGTGVGLAMVRKAMERMGGRVWAQSELGHGATFTLELPEES